MIKKSIAFLLPRVSLQPAGGYKVIFEYANHMAAVGFEVHIVYPAYIFRYGSSGILNLVRKAKDLIVSRKERRAYTTWFPLHANVKEHFVWDLQEKRVPEADYYVATYIKTAIYLDQYIQIDAQHKLYFIQGYENWSDVGDENVIKSYHLNLRKIVVSKWLENIVNKSGETCTFIPNGFDFSYFQKTINIEDKDKYCITMLYHENELKGCADGFKALAMVKEKFPALHVNLFGVPEKPKDLPRWYTYFRMPDKETHNRIYNEAAIFLGTSHNEGWGLTIGEAMICGCAIVCTDNRGYKEMVSNESTALISPIKAPEALAENIIRLMEDDSLRMALAARGNEHIKKFNWESSLKKFEGLFT